jgi:ribonuclease BN (tRNA processing enzyme)
VPAKNALLPCGMIGVLSTAIGDTLMVSTSQRARLIMLGTGTPNLEATRFQSSLVIVAPAPRPDLPARAYVLDCGGGALQRLRQAHAKYDESLAPARLTSLFLTHLHPDHTTGLADFIIAPWVEGRTDPLEIIAPTGTIKLVEHLMQAYSVGIGEHRDGLAPIAGEPHAIVRELTNAPIGTLHKNVYQDDWVVVDALRVTHGNLIAYAYRFRTAGGTVVVSGDTGALPAMADFAHEADILVHEVYSAEMLQSRPEAWQTYHRAFHTSTSELGRIISEAQPRQTILTHQLLWGTSPDALLDEIRAHAPTYTGELIYGEDLMLVEV